MNSGQVSFQDRVQRINQNFETEMAMRPKVKQPGIVQNAKYPLSFVLAVLIGILAGIAGRYVQFHMLGLPAHVEDGDIQLIMDNVFAGIVVGVIRFATDFSSKEHMMCKMGGAWLVILAYHNLVHWMPDLFNLLFSAEYTVQLIRATEPNTIIFRGMTFYFEQ